MINFQPTPASSAPVTAKRRHWLRLAAFVAAVMLVLIARPAWHLTRVAWNDCGERSPIPAGEIDDASRLNQTAVAEVIDVPVEADRTEAQLVELLARARRENLKVSITGARHSMGGHTIYPGGISINMLPLNHMELDEESVREPCGATSSRFLISAACRWQ